MHRFLPSSPGKVLEIGCGEGTFAESIADAKERWGVEPYPEAAAIARSRLDRALNATFDEAVADLPVRYFDTIVCNDVIEHVPDHDRFLCKIKDLLTDGGSLVGSIPNIRYYRTLFDLVFAKDWRYADAGILDRTHLRFFTEKSLRGTLRAHGFGIEVLRGINGGLTRKAPVSGAAACAAIVVSLGYFRDIWHLQFGFRARLEQDCRGPRPSGAAS